MVIFALSGSLRENSSNTALVKFMKSVTPAGTEFILYEALGDLPHFNPDRDTVAVPAPVAELRGMLYRSDAIIISTPEYAHGVPGVLKNALDWLVSTTALMNKPVAIIMGSADAGTFARDSLAETLRTMNAKVETNLMRSISGVQTRVDDPVVWQDLKTLVEDLTLEARKKS